MGFLFKIEEKDEYYHDERLFEIQLLRRRIEKLRDTLCTPRRESIPRDESVEELRPLVEQTQEERKSAEMNELKAKLLGRMK